ncbi:hypothetical protein EV401DRAFT_1930665 [Pisolithus croceorrhizus]|nr:hypothetical protein EV401DRAFT_1930665 [Pisolithus croceorrhizus]
MGDIETRSFSEDYSGLIDESIIAVGLAVICITSHEVIKRRRRGTHPPDGLGSVESWQFGYLYQGRSWARNPSPPLSQGSPLSWVKEAVTLSQTRVNELRGVDAALYVRFLQGCLYFTLLHTFTTVPILLPIDIHFSPDDVGTYSMTRASIASLVLTPEGLGLLWIQVCLLFWLTLTWIATLVYICNGAFEFRAARIEEAARVAESDAAAERDAQYHPHPHPQLPFHDIPSPREGSKRGLRLRTVMVSNLPVELRSEQNLKEYFEYYMSRPIDLPSVGITSSAQPGFVDKVLAFSFHRARRIPKRIQLLQVGPGSREPRQGSDEAQGDTGSARNIPIIERVVVARKMTELASLLERREGILCALEEAHVKLARRALATVFREVERRKLANCDITDNAVADVGLGVEQADVERQMPVDNNAENMDLLVRTLSPFVVQFGVAESSIHKVARKSRNIICFRRKSRAHRTASNLAATSGVLNESHYNTVWDALLSLPRSVLHPYQPLVHLSVLFRGKKVPAIDYYTAKLKLLTMLITQNRAKAVDEYDPVSTAFVTFKDPKDARKACRYLAVHPDNPLACLVTMAPQYEDIDWRRVMKATFRGELVKDWVVSLGVWAFTIFWLFPISLFVGLVSIQSIASFWPSLYNYLSDHPWQQDVIQSFLPTILVSLLTILVPLILLLIAKKAYTITTLSLIHDTIMICYYKFLIVNILVFFCVGVAVLQSFLTSFHDFSESNILQTLADSFPSAGPFYVGWLIFTTAIHSSLELLPLFTYFSTRRQTAPRKRADGIRPRTFNYYYWLPNHLLIIHVCLLFAILNPLVVPFGLIYFTVETVVVKNQFLHVYAKNYECNGQILLIRMVRYSLDGLMFSQFVFLAYMAVLKKTVNLALAAVLFIITAAVKIIMTRMCRSRFERDNIMEATAVCGVSSENGSDQPIEPSGSKEDDDNTTSHTSRFRTWRLPQWINFSYAAGPRFKHSFDSRPPIPFRERQRSFSRLDSVNESSREERLEDTPRQLGGTSGSTSLVQKHPPHPTWDDEPRHDIPYDNPFYNRPITSALWLPRNPCGVLDLDDTIDLHQSLTSEPGAGDLGFSQPSSPSGAPMTPVYESPARSPDVEHGSILVVPPKQYSGQEEIDLPEGIRNRVLEMDRREEIESTDGRRPSLFRQRISSHSRSGKSSIQRVPRRHHTMEDQAVPTTPSSERGERSSRPRAMSFRQTHQQDSRFLDPALCPDSHAQAELTHSTTSIVPHASRASVTENVTTGEAVLNEAIAEERMAAERRLKQEEADAAHHHRRLVPAWLASWFYARVITR